MPAESQRRELGLRRPESWPRALGLALAVLIALLIAEAFLEALLHATREQGLEPPRWEPDRAVPFALNAAVVVLVAPVVEELTFRGLGFSLLSATAARSRWSARRPPSPLRTVS